MTPAVQLGVGSPGHSRASPAMAYTCPGEGSTCGAQRDTHKPIAPTCRQGDQVCVFGGKGGRLAGQLLPGLCTAQPTWRQHDVQTLFRRVVGWVRLCLHS